MRKKANHVALSNAGRAMMRVVLDTVSRRVKYRLYQYDGLRYSDPNSNWVVNYFTSTTPTGTAGSDNVTYGFNYTVTTAAQEFNFNTQSAQFEACEVTQTGPNSNNTTRTTFKLDQLAKPLRGGDMVLNGREINTIAYNSTAVDTTVRVDAYDSSFNLSPTWPASLYTPRLRKTVSKEQASNKSFRVNTKFILNYNNNNGAPQFVYDSNAYLGSPTNTRAVYPLRQTIFDATTFLPKLQIQYVFGAVPATAAALNAYPPMNFPYRDTGAVSSSMAEYDTNFLFVKDLVWRNSDSTLTTTQLKQGKHPKFSLTYNWEIANQVTMREPDFSLVRESRGYRFKDSTIAPEGMIHTTQFHEGLRHDPVAAVSNSKYANCAILMGENGNAGLTPPALDYPSRWVNFGTSFSAEQVHTGRYAMMVVNSYGPAINLYLKDVRTLQYGYKISAWIYDTTTAQPPILSGTTMTAAGVGVTGLTGSPADGTGYQPRKWQRWELNITYAQLIAGNLFNAGVNDYLNIWMGAGTPVGGSTRAIFVDDVVCIPDIARFQMATFDAKGAMTSKTGSDHLTTYFEIGPRGNIIAARDERFRIMGQNAFHHIGEN